MNLLSRKALAASAGILLLVARPAIAQQDVSDPPDPWIHEPTGTPFPAQVGEFERIRVVEYSEDGRDASSAYALVRGDSRVTVTFYVYPASSGTSCEGVFAHVKAPIEEYPGAEILAEGRERAPSGEGAPVALYAAYTIPANAMREGYPASRSDAYLYCPPGNKWLVKYRATWPEGTSFKSDVDLLLHSIAWPEELGGQAG